MATGPAMPQEGPGGPMGGPGMGGPEGGGQSPVAEHGMMMIESFMQDPSEEAKAELAAIAQAIQAVLTQGAGGPEGAMGGPQGPPPPDMGGQPPMGAGPGMM